MFRKTVLWTLIILWMVTIFCFSSQEAVESKRTSSKFIISVVDFFDFDNSMSQVEKEIIAEDLTFIVRKGAHFCAYAVFGVLLFWLLGEYNVLKTPQIIFSVSAVFLYACSDEFHQTFVKGRSGEIRDIVIDTLGGLTGVLLIKLFGIIINRIKKRHTL